MVKIDDTHFIDADSNCCILQEIGIVEDENSENYGKEKFTTLGYYTTIESAINGYIKLMARKYISKDRINTLKELTNNMNEMKKLLEENIKY